MKGKIYTLLLAVVAVAMAAGIFASCKDYGEDINNLQDQINKAALKSELTTAQSTLQKAADDAKQAADDAMAEAKKRLSESDFEDFANRLEKILRDHQDSLKTAFDKNFDQDEALKDTARNIRNTVSDVKDQLKNDIEGAKTYTDEELDKLVKKYKLENVVTMTVQDYTTLMEMLSQSKELASLIDMASSLEELEAASRKVETFTSIVDELYTGVTSVELIATFTDDSNIDHYLANYSQTGKTTNGTEVFSKAPFKMAFFKGTQKGSSNNRIIFGDEVTTQGDFTNKVGYQGLPIKDEVNILVRVSPVNADLSKIQTANDKNILIVNSQGEALDDYLIIGHPKKYNEILTYTDTRATNIGSGLWVIPVSMKSGVTIKDYMLATHPDAKLNSADEIADLKAETLYAVAIKNTNAYKEDNPGIYSPTKRYAVSSYDLVSTYENYKPATVFTFQVNGTDVEDIYNRWYVNAIEGTIEQIHAEENKTESKQECMWRQKVGEKLAGPETWFDRSISVSARNKNFGQPTGIRIETNSSNPLFTGGSVTKYDERYAEYQTNPNIIKVEVGEPIILSNFVGGRPQTSSDGTVLKGDYEETRLDYYYVVLDSIGAIESRPSEMNAWYLAYKYEGLNKVYKVGEKCTIKILSEAAKGDIIGFRVYACNLDGTLADPDGRSFYVMVDEPVEHGKITPIDASQTANNIVAKMASADGSGYTNNSTAYNFGIFKVNPQSGGWLDYSFTDNTFRVGTDEYPTTTPGTTLPFTAANGGEVTLLQTDYPNLLAGNLKIKYWLIKELYENGTPKSYATKWSEAKYIGISADEVENWVDGSTLDFTLVGYENNTAMNFLDISIRKQMPVTADIPADKAVKWYPEWAPSGSTLNVYPTPCKDNTGTDFTTPWDPANTVTYSKVYLGAFATNVNTTNDSYKWVIKGAGENPTDITLQTSNIQPTPVKNKDFTAIVPVANIGNNYDGIIYYKFPRISRVSPTSAIENYDAPAWTGKIAIGNAIDLLKYKVKAYDAYTDASGNPVKKSDYYFKWGDNTTDGTIAKDEYASFWGLNSTSAITVSSQNLGKVSIPLMLECNSISKELSQAKTAGVETITGSGGNFTFDVANVLGNYDIKASDITIAGDAAAYLKVNGDPTPAGVITIASNAPSGPTMQWTGTITIEGRDALGKKHTLVKDFPFTLLP